MLQFRLQAVSEPPLCGAAYRQYSYSHLILVFLLKEVNHPLILLYSFCNSSDSL